MSLFLRILFVITIFILSSTPTKAQERRPWQVKDSFQVKKINGLQLSPDGNKLLYVVSKSSLKDNAKYKSIWIWFKEEGESIRMTDKKGSASSPRWSPDGTKIAFLKRNEDGYELWTINPDGSGKERLTNFERSNANLGGRGNGLSWSPDGKKLAYTAAGPKHYKNEINPPHLPTGNNVMIIDRMLYRNYYYYSDLRRTYVWTISAKGGKPTKISSGNFDYHSISWSPDGNYIACISNQTGRDDFNANNDIVLLSTNGNSDKMIQLTHTSGPEYNVTWAPNGSKLAYKGRNRSARSKESDAELKKIYTISIASDISSDIQTRANLSGSLDRWAGQYQWGEHSKRIYFTVQNEGRVELYSAPAGGGSVTSIVDGKGQVGSFSVAGDGTVYYVYHNLTSPDEVYRLNSDGGEKEQLTSFNQNFVKGLAINDAEHFRYHSFDGLRIDGWIMKPTNFKQGNKYPTILFIHGGPHLQVGYRPDVYYGSYRPQELAAKGYAVVFINPRGSTGRGQCFSDKLVGDIGGGDYKDIMEGLDYAIGRYKFIEADRLGVTGVSYGGYMTNWTITQTNRFKAAVSVSGISDLITQWSDGTNFLWEESDLGIKPYENYDLAWDRSPLKYVLGAATPTLFVEGRWDNGAGYHQAVNMYMPMKRLGVDTKIALYPNGNHGVRMQPRHTADYHKRALRWFDKYLK